MAGKRSKRREEAAHGDAAKIAKNEAEAKIRRQVLPKETLMEVFNCSKRVDLDQWGTVSRQYDATIQRAHSLRQVETVTLRYDDAKKVYMAVFVYKETMKADPKTEPELKRLLKTSANVRDIVEAFFSCLRFCIVNVQLRIEYFPFDKVFLELLKDASKHFKIDLSKSNELLVDVGAFDVFCAFPSHRAVNSSTLSFLGPNYKDSSDAFLRSLAEHGVLDVGDAGQNVFMPATDEGILDFAFSAYGDDKGVRRLSIITDEVSSQFLVKLVKACRESKGSHPLDVCLEADADFDIGELVANGELQTVEDGDYRGCQVWKFQFDDLPSFEVVYLPSSEQALFYGPKIQFWRDCTPNFTFLQSASCEW